MSLDFLKSPVFMRVCAGCANGNEATATFSPGEVLFIGDAVQIPLKIKVDRAQERPESRTISFWDEWKSGKTMDLEAGIHIYMKD